jgi:hypothetical protein
MRIIVKAAALAAVSAGTLGLGGAMASAASAGTTTQGSWTLTAPETSTSSSSAQVLQPINADGSSVFNNKSRTVPVQFKVIKTSTNGFKFESIVNGDSGQAPVTSGIGENDYSAASYSPPSGTTVDQLTSLVADYSWQFGTDHGGSLRWSITLDNGKSIFVYFGDEPNTTSESASNGSGVNLLNAGDLRFDTSQVGGTFYDTWANAQALASGHTVSDVSLVVDGGWAGDQILNLSDAKVTVNGSTSTFTMPTTTTTTTQDNSAPAWVYLSKVSGATPTSNIDETTLTSTQGDSGGQYRQVDGKYMYNLPIAGLDTTATYEVGVSFQSDGHNPIPTPVHFGLK